MLGQFPHLGQVGEPVWVQQTFSDLRVHAVDPGILRGLARIDEVELHSVLVSSLIHVPTTELRTVVAALVKGITAEHGLGKFTKFMIRAAQVAMATENAPKTV